MTHCLCHERGTRFSAVPGSTPNTLLWCRFSERYQIPYFALSGSGLACFLFADNAVGLPHFADVSVGLSWSRILRRGHSHDLVPEFSEQSALEWLCRVVFNHVPCGTPNYRHFILTYSISDKGVTSVICFVRLLLEALPFFSRRTELLLS
jgi:hypothetical protein